MRIDVLEYINRIKKEPDLITDMDIYHYVANLELSQNCITAGNLLLGVISSICYLRPSLNHLLIRIALRPLFYVGVEDIKELLEWTNSLCETATENKEKQELYLFTDEGIIWLKQQFPLKKEIIKKCFNELNAVCNIYDLIFALKSRKKEHLVSINSIFNKREYNIEFQRYKELQEFIFEILSSYIDIDSYGDVTELYCLIDEELKEFQQTFS